MKWKNIIMNMCLLLIVMICLTCWYGLKNSLPGQHIDAQFENGNKAEQWIVLLSESDAIDGAEGKELISRITEQQTSLAALCGITSGTVQTAKKSSDVEIIFTAGDFFYFHPEISLIAGSFYDMDDTMDDVVVIDEMAAWRLFGSSDVAGMYLKMADSELLVRGVVSGNEGRVYLPQSKAQTLLNYSDFTCLELVMVCHTKDYVRNYINTMPGDNLQKGVFTKITGRFNASSLIGELYSFWKGSGTYEVVIPFWELQAISVSHKCIIFMCAAFILSGIIIIYTLKMLFRLFYRKFSRHS